ncbi:uncharacterized protein LOC111792721 [Cucurbita pepo subsp. pepo]|uniref:uncharacterized protein LOC111792721 n=1 Tax=Cucurbita pepo subsp. pepo TaxID=3664 RepID=UPI000C9D7571|nr:uncharacterized protein LOC111792721 [Cucurbita pepo subsp. pepo]
MTIIDFLFLFAVSVTLWHSVQSTTIARSRGRRRNSRRSQWRVVDAIAGGEALMDRERESRPPEQGTKTMLKSKELPQWANELILARRPAATWLAKRSVQHRDFEGKFLQKFDGLFKISFIFNENADEDPEVRVFVKDERSIEKKVREVMLAKGRPIVLEKVRLYVQSSMAKGDLEVIGWSQRLINRLHLRQP